MLCLSEEVDDESLETLMKLGLSDRFPNEFARWERRREEIAQHFRETCSKQQKEMLTKLVQIFENIKVRLRQAVVVEVLKAFP